MPYSTTPEGPIGDEEAVRAHANGQTWVVTWHRPAAMPDGQPHGSAGLCVTPQANVVLVSADGIRSALPAGRSEGAEDWEQTLRREMQEEACATVRAARLLGFSRGHCVRGHEAGLVLVRAIWRAEVELQPWAPQFEIRHRSLVPAADLLSHLAVHDAGHLPIYRRAMTEARLA